MKREDVSEQKGKPTLQASDSVYAPCPLLEGTGSENLPNPISHSEATSCLLASVLLAGFRNEFFSPI